MKCLCPPRDRLYSYIYLDINLEFETLRLRIARQPHHEVGARNSSNGREYREFIQFFLSDLNHHHFERL